MLVGTFARQNFVANDDDAENGGLGG